MGVWRVHNAPRAHQLKHQHRRALVRLLALLLAQQVKRRELPLAAPMARARAGGKQELQAGRRVREDCMDEGRNAALILLGDPCGVWVDCLAVLRKECAQALGVFAEVGRYRNSLVARAGT